jgi:predicted TIM-barrel enzyme
MFKSPLKNLILEVAVASGLSVYALNHVAKQEFTQAAMDAVIAAGCVSASKSNYRKVKKSTEQAPPKPVL